MSIKGIGYSTIDCIFTANRALLTGIKVNNSSGINTPSHFPVSAIMSCNLPTGCDKPNKNDPRLPPMHWSKCDISMCCNIVSDLVHSLPRVPPQDDFFSNITWCDSLSDIYSTMRPPARPLLSVQDAPRHGTATCPGSWPKIRYQ